MRCNGNRCDAMPSYAILCHAMPCLPCAPLVCVCWCCVTVALPLDSESERATQSGKERKKESNKERRKEREKDSRVERESEVA